MGGIGFKFLGRRFSGFSNADAEPQRVVNVWFVAADNASGFVIGGVIPMSVDRRGARLQPYF